MNTESHVFFYNKASFCDLASLRENLRKKILLRTGTLEIKYVPVSGVFSLFRKNKEQPGNQCSFEIP